MNASILAARTATAIADIEAQVQRLGGELVVPAPRGDAAVQRLQTLEGIAAALAGIAGKATDVDAPVEAVKATREKARK